MYKSHLISSSSSYSPCSPHRSKEWADHWNGLRYVSPRKRAQRTLELLNLGCHGKLPWDCEVNESTKDEGGSSLAQVEVTQDIREWDYGDYEGLKTPVIREQRKKDGIVGSWEIWRDGCPGGE